MWILTTRVRTRANKREEFLNSIALLVTDSRVQEGNVGCDYHVDEHDDNSITITSFWQSGDDLKKYMESELFKVLKGAARLLCEEEETNYYKISK
jgi:quinol monooxygenase YgiN